MLLMQFVLKLILVVLICFLSVEFYWTSNLQAERPDPDPDPDPNPDPDPDPKQVSAKKFLTRNSESFDDFPAILKAKKLRDFGKKCGFFSLEPFDFMRTGNLMFHYAFAFSAAKKFRRKLIIPEIPLLQGAFKISAEKLENSEETKNFEILQSIYEEKNEKNEKKFDLIGLEIRLKCEKNYSFRAHSQSFRYFKSYEKEIRKEFEFLPEIQKKCEKSVNFFKNRENSQKLVGIHVRRGDFLIEQNKWMGFISVEKDFLLNATNLIKEKFSDQKLNFLLLGEDFFWNQKNFAEIPEFRNRILPPNENPAVDLCILSECDHVIMTTGTFGWWGGFLSGGLVIYKKNFFKKNSPMERIYVPAQDFFPEHWIGI